MEQINLLKSKGIQVTKLIAKREELRNSGKNHSLSTLANPKKEKFIYISIYGMYLALINFPV
jgi:hypothetical protein